jgi:hypothetical protein
MTERVVDNFASHPQSNEPAPYAPALIRLLQGIVYSDDSEIWELVLRYQYMIESYFAQMGVELYLNEPDGFAYLTQPDREDEKGAAIPLPRLTRRRALTYSVTLVLVLLREQLNQFDSTNVDTNRLILTHEALLDLMRPFYIAREDERSLIRQMERDINQVVELGFLKELKQDKHVSYLIRPVLKSRVNSEQLAQIKLQLEQHSRDDSNPS